MKKMVCFLSMLTVSYLAFAQEGKQYISDFDTFIEYLEETHPDPYTPLGGKMKFAYAVQETQKRIKECTDDKRFKEILVDFIARLEDGHTFIYADSKTQNNKSNKFFPLVFKVATDGLFVDFTSDKYTSHIGSKLLGINDFSLMDLLERVKKNEPVENHYGALYGLRNKISNIKSIEKIIELNDQDNIILNLQSVEGDIYSLKVFYEERPNWVRAQSEIQFTEYNDLLYYEIIENENVGYFSWNGVVSKEVVVQMPFSHPQFDRVVGWIYSIMKQKQPKDKQVAIANIPELYSSFSSFLKAMKDNQTKNLIIDLRENSGGMTPLCMPLLYMLYGDDYLNFESKAQYNTLLSPLLLKKQGFNSIEDYNKSENTNYKIGDYVFDSFFSSNKKQTISERRHDLSLISYKNGIGKEFTENLEGKSIYRPNVIVLTSPQTFSASYHFLYYLTEIGDAIVVGVPPRQAGNAFMETTLFELPNTKITGSISNSAQIMYPFDLEKGKIFMPDFPMNIEDYKKYNFDKNAEILFALDLIKQFGK